MVRTYSVHFHSGTTTTSRGRSSASRISFRSSSLIVFLVNQVFAAGRAVNAGGDRLHDDPRPHAVGEVPCLCLGAQPARDVHGERLVVAVDANDRPLLVPVAHHPAV